jgi:hypothetical protein
MSVEHDFECLEEGNDLPGGQASIISCAQRHVACADGYPRIAQLMVVLSLSSSLGVSDMSRPMPWFFHRDALCGIVPLTSAAAESMPARPPLAVSSPSSVSASSSSLASAATSLAATVLSASTLPAWIPFPPDDAAALEAAYCSSSSTSSSAAPVVVLDGRFAVSVRDRTLVPVYWSWKTAATPGVSAIGGTLASAVTTSTATASSSTSTTSMGELAPQFPLPHTLRAGGGAVSVVRSPWLVRDGDDTPWRPLDEQIAVLVEAAWQQAKALCVWDARRPILPGLELLLESPEHMLLIDNRLALDPSYYTLSCSAVPEPVLVNLGV